MKGITLFCYLSVFIIISISGCSTNKSNISPKAFVVSPESDEIYWGNAANWFEWDSSFISAGKSKSAGFKVSILQVETAEDWKRIDSENSRSCPNADFDFYFAKAFYLKWENTVEVKYCFREGTSGNNSFQVYYLPIARFTLEEESDGDSIEADKLSKLKIYITNQPKQSYKNEDDQAHKMARFLLIDDHKEKLHIINLTDIHPYLSRETRGTVLESTAGDTLLRGNQLYWRQIKPANLDQVNCVESELNGDSLSYRDQLLQGKTFITPRYSCKTIADMQSDSSFRLGFAYNNSNDYIAYVLLKSGDSFSAFPIDFSGTIHTEDHQEFTLKYHD